jgi:hypothetical protein
MKIYAFCFLFLASLASGQQAAPSGDVNSLYKSGNGFLRVCGSRDAMPSDPVDAYALGVCDGYVIGVVTGAGLKAGTYCLGPAVTNSQTFNIVLKFMKDNPAQTDRRTDLLIVDAMKAAFPCPANK